MESLQLLLRLTHMHAQHTDLIPHTFIYNYHQKRIVVSTQLGQFYSKGNPHLLSISTDQVDSYTAQDRQINFLQYST